MSFYGLDFQGDIKNGELQDGEYWQCPNHGIAPHEGILCKLPTYTIKDLLSKMFTITAYCHQKQTKL
jgi:hypothetical protein